MKLAWVMEKKFKTKKKLQFALFDQNSLIQKQASK